jgi:ethanolamine-phosphate cytidylyltransferase
MDIAQERETPSVQDTMADAEGYKKDAPPKAPTRGYIDGCFDIMHSGHYNAIRQAKCICDVLVTGVHSDNEIAANKSIPVMKQAERYALLDHIKWIDEVVYDVPYSPLLSTLESSRADFCIHGDDMPVNAQGFCAYDEMRNAGKLRIVKRTEGVSTTDLIGRLLATQNHGALGRLLADLRSLFANTQEGLIRATAPVQMLTSTRRLAEFSTSRIPTKDDKIVYVSGSFDMFHVGHAQMLKDAKAKGTFLLVGVYEDNIVKQTKGPNLPVMSTMERVLNVSACKWVDEVLIGAPKTVTEDLIATWGIQVVARGCDHQQLPSLEEKEYFRIPKERKIYVEIPSQWPHLCHETVLQRVIEERETYIKRNADRAKREDDYYKGKSDKDPMELAGGGA